MDLALFGRVLWRFRMIVVPGLLFAIVLATLALVRIGPGGVSYRQKEQWVSYSTVFVTQKGFTWGSIIGEPGGQATLPKRDAATGADPNRLARLAILYAQLATSDPVLNQLSKGKPPHIEAAPIMTDQGSSGEALPFVRIAAFGTSQHGAVVLARRATAALQRYVHTQQVKNWIAPQDRVELNVVNRASAATLFAGRSKTLPIVIFITIAVATIGLAFVLENLRPRVRAVTADRGSATASGAA